MVRRVQIAVFICLTLPVLAAAGEGQKSADLGLNFNQSTYSDSWTGGEFGSLNWTFTGNLVLENAFSPKVNWKNDLKLTFGQTHMQVEDDQGNRKWRKPEKSADRIFDESLLKFTLNKVVDPYLAVTFESQFYDASVPELTRALNPILLTESAGVGRTLSKTERMELFTRLGLGLRQHIDRVVQFDTLGEPEGTQTETKTNSGLEWVTDFSRTFGDGDLKVVSKLRVFQAFYNSKKDEVAGTPEEDYWRSPDLAWETTFSAAVSKYIQTSLFFELLFDKEIDTDLRWREVLALGVTYKMF